MAGHKQVAKASKAKTAGKPKDELAARQAVIDTALAMSRQGLSPGRSGNVSCRWAGGMLITPSGMAYEKIKPADVVHVTTDGDWPMKGRNPRTPSSEWQFHLSTYQARADINAVVHTHSIHAVILACANRPIPAFHYMVAVAGATSIPCVPYAIFGSRKLARYVATGLTDANACLMANHGQIAVGASLSAALELASEVEILAEQYYKVLTLGRPNILSDSEMKKVLKRFKTYGQNANSRNKR